MRSSISALIFCLFYSFAIHPGSSAHAATVQYNYTGNNFTNHIGNFFPIAVMSNHYHLVLKLSPHQLDALSDREIIDPWCSLFKCPLLIQKYRAGESLADYEKAAIGEIVTVWHKRLADISCYMRCLNQNIARRANLEDGCTGRFWECRFQSQALKTEEALISCMAYVDLNPVRATMAERLVQEACSGYPLRARAERLAQGLFSRLVQDTHFAFFRGAY